MTCQQQGQDSHSHNDAIPAKGFETVLRDKADEELNSQQRHHKRHNISNKQSRQIVYDNVHASVTKELETLIDNGGKHRRHYQEKQELDSSLADQFLCHTDHNDTNRTRD